MIPFLNATRKKGKTEASVLGRGMQWEEFVNRLYLLDLLRPLEDSGFSIDKPVAYGMLSVSSRESLDQRQRRIANMEAGRFSFLPYS